MHVIILFVFIWMLTFFKNITTHGLKPFMIPGGWLVRGENRMEDADSLMEEIDEKVSKNDELSDKVQIVYMKDPTPYTDDDFDAGKDLDEKVLLVFGKDMSPDTNPLVNSIISILGLSFLTIFAVGCFAFNDDLNTQLKNANELGEMIDLSSFKDMITPLMASLGGIQIAHEIGHRVIGFKDKTKAGVPTIIPAIQTGTLGTVTQIKQPPKNLKALFDFAIAGPLTGMAVSLGLLFVGLQITLTESPKNLPSIPLEFLKLSTLGGEIVQSFLGDGFVFAASDPLSTVIPLHPFAIAGYTGILINALALLPIGSTDGGRISLTVFGRPLSKLIQSFVTFFLLGIGFFGLDESNLFLTYVIFVVFTQRESEIPCKNEADELDFGRVCVSIAAAVLVTLALTPIVN